MKAARRSNPRIGCGDSEGRFANHAHKKLACLFLLVLVLCSCTWFRPQPFSPIATVAPANLSPAEIYSVLNQRTHPLSTLWAHMKIYLSGKNIKGKKFFEATLLYEIADDRFPQEEDWAGKLRLRGYRTITSTLFECLVLPDRVQVYLNKEQELYSGTPQTLLNNPSLFYGINPADIARALEIERTITHVVKETRPDSQGSIAREGPGAQPSQARPIFNRIATLPGHYVFIHTRPDNEKRVFAVRKTDLLVDRAALYDSNHRLAVEVTYHRYDLFGGHLLPTKITVHFPQSQASMSARILEYKINPPLQPAVFNFALPPSVQEYPLEDLFKRMS